MLTTDPKNLKGYGLSFRGIMSCSEYFLDCADEVDD